MIAKIIPANRRGTFFGLQSSASNMLASLSAIAAGFILEKVDNPLDFAICFFLAAVIMVISLVFLAMAKEPERRLPDLPPVQIPVWSRMTEILRRDENFRKFLIARVLSQIAMMGFAFYTVYAVRIHGVSESEIGIMTGILLGSQILANPLMGWIGDRWSNLFVMKIGIIAATLSALLAWWAPSPAYFFLVFILTGIANVSMWTIGIAIVLEFGSEAEQPVYIGMSNTLVTPATILAPFLGGWLADLSGYPSAFLASALAGMAALGVYMLFVKDPRQKNQALQQNLAFQYNLAGTPDPIDKRESEHEQDLENTQN
jgi:MFS family permease